MATHVLALVALFRPDLITTSGNTTALVQAFGLLASAVATAFYARSRAAVKVASKDALVVAPGPTVGVHLEPLITKGK